MPPTFVFAVCGAADEIGILNLSLRHLRRFSRKPVRVVTDLRRNEAVISHDDVIDVPTPAGLSHRQAALVLKTGLHRILPMPGLYCYLDSDVIAVGGGVDDVFAHKQGSATFATDHSRLPEFSGYAVRCGCLGQRHAQILELTRQRAIIVERQTRVASKWEEVQRAIAHFQHCSEVLEADRVRLRDAVRAYWRGWAEAQRHGVRWQDYTNHRGSLSEVVDSLGYIWNEKKRAGFDARGRLVWAEDVVRSVERLTGCRLDPDTQRWIDASGDVLDVDKDVAAIDAQIGRANQKGCDHLRQAILERFGVEVSAPNWRQWNSGVFVFDHGDVELLDLWHRWSVALVGDPHWEARDQGTLVAAVWKLGLEGQRPLPIRFNFIADYHRSTLHFDEHRGFSIDGHEGSVQPDFVHVIHHLWDRSWPVWRWIESMS